MSDLINVRVKTMTWEAEGIMRVLLAPVTGRLPPAEPGAHVDLHLPGGAVRQYSLTAGSTPDGYVLGVLREKASRGGSKVVHEALRPGQVVEMSPPRNTFALDDSTAPVLLISGGIGVTPILAMADMLAGTDRDWSMTACARERDVLAFSDELAALGARTRFDDEDGPPDLSAMIAGATRETHLYCCGPTPMLDAFEEAALSAGFPTDQIHLERFAPAKPKAGAGEFIVELARSGESIVVPPDKSILDVIEDAGIEANNSCRVGVCGTCETQVLEGEADHQDMILTEEERAEGRMLICCSRAKTGTLVLDL
ncbi:PDR/VanB family oxidoreductase [Maritimibacter sp. UBA3975]|uniref:PDR/VanB family oxidoreductase n=1 Tax=Maritimibacter sp. UBA3975 TaxID=1946833 RepID=UPI000C09EE5A|nr:PDR/VanB family oxidoreductase [Maritimibacter sp. UBA3975]MAM62352.1 oxidoreductase [Maritimibacter sp.]|tara:strand:+ start:10362 stop:11294 length:933 start_codon:yes stop_codon:yes gene_type:complete